MAVSKKRRFEVFKRDGFKCAYCGKTPPNTVLEIDHIIPKSRGGTDDIDNLITACFDCNRGKSNVLLNKISPKVSEKLEKIKIIEEQVTAYNNFLKRQNRKLKKQSEEIENIFKKGYPDRKLTKRFITMSLKNFLKQLPFEEVKEAMEIAVNNVPDRAYDCTKYFCGICWNKIRGQKNG